MVSVDCQGDPHHAAPENKISLFDEENNLPIVKVNKLTITEHDFLKATEISNFGIGPGICEKCQKESKNCLTCKDLFEKSPRQRWEQQVLNSGLTFKQENGKGQWTVKTKFNKLIHEVPRLEAETINFQKRLEDKKLSKDKELCGDLNAAIERRISSGMFCFLKDVIEDYPELKGLKQVFSPINFVKKEGSLRNKTRPVINASYKPTQKASLNEAKFKGSSLNRNLQEILLFQRGFKILGSTDLDDFYQAIKLSPQDMMLNSMIYRRGGYCGDGDLEVMISRVLNFGFADAQCIAQLAKYRSGEMFIRPVNKRADLMLTYSLTDDIYCGSQEMEEFNQMRAAMDSGLSRGGFTCKTWKISKELPEDPGGEEVLVGHKDDNDSWAGNLGVRWNTVLDVWKIPIKISISEKIRGLRGPEGKIASEEDIAKVLKEDVLTRRVLLRIVSCLFDPLGLFVQLRLMLALVFRKALSMAAPNSENKKKIQWDLKLDNSILPDLVTVVKMLLEVKDLTVPRFVAEGIKGEEVDICLTADGSPAASGARVFVRYPHMDGSIRCNYLMGSAKLTAAGGQTAPKGEVEAGLSALRLASLITKHFALKIRRMYLISDSTIFLGGVTSETAKQKLFYQTRNQQSRDIIKSLGVILMHCESAMNDSDPASKWSTCNYALSSSYWHSRFFEQGIESWPVKRYSLSDDDVVSEILNPSFQIQSLSTSISQSILATISEKSGSFKKMTKVMSYIYLWLPKCKNLFQALELAKKRLIQAASKNLTEKRLSGVRREFIVHEDEGIFYVLPRKYFHAGISVQDRLYLIDDLTSVGKGLLRDLHVCKSGLGSQIAKMINKGFYILRARYQFKRLSSSCPGCRRLKKLQVQALQGPSIQLQAFTNMKRMSVCYIDCQGPYKASLSRFKTKKLFLLNVTCVISRYTIIQPLEDMSANSILMGLRSAFLQVGTEMGCILYSDQGSNLVPLMQLSQEDNNIEEDEDSLVEGLRKTLHHNNVVLKTNVPRSPWRQSLVEVTMAAYKLCLKRSNLFNKTHTMNQWGYIIAQCQHSLNSRALNINYLEDSFTTLTPLKMVFGSDRVEYQNPISLENLSRGGQKLFDRLSKLDQDLASFNRMWAESYHLEIKKWLCFKNEGRKLKIGDVCFILDKINPQTRQCQLSIVKDILSDRSYEVEYCQKSMKVDPKSFQVTKAAKKNVLKRPAQQLCLICSKDEAVNGVSVEPRVEPGLLDKPDEEYFDFPAPVSNPDGLAHEEDEAEVVPAPVPDPGEDTLVYDDDGGGEDRGGLHAEMVPVPVPGLGGETLVRDDDGGNGGGEGSGGLHAEMVPVPVPGLGGETLACDDDGGGGGNGDGDSPALNEDIEDPNDDEKKAPVPVNSTYSPERKTHALDREKPSVKIEEFPDVETNDEDAILEDLEAPKQMNILEDEFDKPENVVIPASRPKLIVKYQDNSEKIKDKRKKKKRKYK